METDFSVYASLLSATPSDAENLASWLADREAENEAKMMEVDETVQDEKLMATVSGRYDEEIAVSQIRILSKRYTSEPDIIPYVAVIDKWDDEMWLIVPFSHYNTPATPGEMATGLIAYGLHVLQAWNGRTVQDSILKNSYLVGTISDEVRNDALALFRHQMFGSKLPESFASYRGSPIVEASDPRREYLSECIERLKPLSEAVLAEAEQVINAGKGVLYASQEYWLERIRQVKDNALQERMAAKTIDDRKAVILRLEDDSPEVFANAYAECELLTPFRPTTKPYNLKFRMTVPDDWKNCKNVAVVVRNADTGELMGEGKLDTSSGIGIVAIKKTDVVVNRASQMVLVMAKGSSNEDI